MQVVSDVAQRHGFSVAGVTAMVQAVAAARGDLVRFRHEDFGGHGQWMEGGSITLADRFDPALRHRVATLCAELAAVLRDDAQAASELFVVHAAEPAAHWWPAELGEPNCAGVCEGMRYAWFANAHRMVIERDGERSVYDTLDHYLGGCAPTGSEGGGLNFISQRGMLDVTRLPLIARAPC
jgi:hypothetical protein